MKIPAVITQGDSVSWQDGPAQDSLGNPITSDHWTLNWYFAGPTTLQVASSASNSGWLTSLSATQTAGMAPDTYFWQALAANGGQKVTIGSGRITIAANLISAPTGYDGRSQAEQDLSAVQAAIRARIEGGAIAEYWIGSRKLRNEPMAELLVLESRLKLIVAKERQAQSIANGLGDPRNTFVRFG